MSSPGAINPIITDLPKEIQTLRVDRSGDGDASVPGVFAKLLDDVNTLQTQAGELEKQMYEGGKVELHQVMIAAEQAGVAFELTVEIRNRLVDAYQELMRMPV